jgi:hypothetical protein
MGLRVNEPDETPERHPEPAPPERRAGATAEQDEAAIYAEARRRRLAERMDGLAESGDEPGWVPWR